MPVFGVFWSVFSRLWTRKTLNTRTFHTVFNKVIVFYMPIIYLDRSFISSYLITDAVPFKRKVGLSTYAECFEILSSVSQNITSSEKIKRCSDVGSYWRVPFSRLK